MKTLLFALSTFATALDPGCGAAVGGDVASGPMGDAPVTMIDPGGLPQMTCGALGAHYFCDTFDESSLPGKWDKESIFDGTLSLTTQTWVSSPRSLLAKTSPFTSGTRTYAQLVKGFSPSGRRFAMAYSEHVDPGCEGVHDTVQSGNLTLKSDAYFLAVGHSSQGDSIIETSLTNGIYVQAHLLPTPLPRGTWAKVELFVDLEKSTMDFSVNGTTVVSGEKLKYPPGSPQVPSLTVGTLTDGAFNEAGCSIHIDDVTFDIQP